MKKVPKPKPKPKPKAKPKPKKVVIKTSFRPSKKQLAVLTAMEKQKQVEDDWRLKAIHHNINQAKKAIHDLSSEHESSAKTIERCHDRIEHVEGLVIQLTELIDHVVRSNLVQQPKSEIMTQSETEERIRAALKGLD